MTDVRHPPVAGLAEELDALGPDHLLDRSGALEAWWAPAERIPRLLQEVGRLRAVTFRAAGEGVEGEVDLDRYDPHYQHLLLWDRASGVLVGGYRLGLCDALLAQGGLDALYTHELFAYAPGFADRLGGAIEAGRSFIRPEYQRQPRALLLLWSAIGRFIAREPGRRAVLFGAVSLAATYRPESQGLVVDWLRTHHLDAALAALVTPRTPPSPLPRLTVPEDDVRALDQAVRALEPDGRGLPVLFRKYLGLGGVFLGFNRDAAFGDVLDGLVWVDLRHTNPIRLAAYVGADVARVLQA